MGSLEEVFTTGGNGLELELVRKLKAVPFDEWTVLEPTTPVWRFSYSKGGFEFKVSYDGWLSVRFDDTYCDVIHTAKFDNLFMHLILQAAEKEQAAREVRKRVNSVWLQNAVNVLDIMIGGSK